VHLVTFLRGRGQKIGAAWHGAILDLHALAAELAFQRGERRVRFPGSMLALIQGGHALWDTARAAYDYGRSLVDAQDLHALSRRGIAHPEGRVRLLAPIPRPARNIFCMGRNYVEHAAERGAQPPDRPVFFTKPSTAVIGPHAAIVHHDCTAQLDYEAELAVVIGRGGRDIPRAEALAHVFGYMNLNDVTARDLQRAHLQWFKGKSLDTFCPMGPALVTADEVPDPQRLSIQLQVNGRVRQSASTAQMIFDVATLIEVLSMGMTLEPGDILATGTPAGVGAATGEFLKAGDVVEVQVEGLGSLINPVAAPDSVR
jgi:2-keto-4-pentenoate hydratase/2-oxohepta-3-ene-1,7-dioic acid hydratase in catechol pathway